MPPTVLLLLPLFLLLVPLFLLFLLRRAHSSPDEPPAGPDAAESERDVDIDIDADADADNLIRQAATATADAENAPGNSRINRRAAALRRRRGGLSRMRRAAAAAAEADGERDADDEDRTDREALAGPSSSRGRRSVKKEANRQAKREAQQQHQEMLRGIRERQQAADEARLAEQQQREHDLREAQEEATRLADEVAKKEKEEYDQWKNHMEVDDAGEDAAVHPLHDSQLLEKFCGTVRSEKVVVLEALAAEFGLTTEDVIDRLTALDKEGTLTGVFDDRGKFIYVTLEEMTAVAELIRNRGRISIQQLAEESSKLLNLDAPVESPQA